MSYQTPKKLPPLSNVDIVEFPSFEGWFLRHIDCLNKLSLELGGRVFYYPIAKALQCVHCHRLTSSRVWLVLISLLDMKYKRYYASKEHLTVVYWERI